MIKARLEYYSENTYYNLLYLSLTISIKLKEYLRWCIQLVIKLNINR